MVRVPEVAAGDLGAVVGLGLGVRGFHLLLEVADPMECVARGDLGHFPGHRLDEPLHEAELVGGVEDGEVPVSAEVFDFPAEDEEREAVEGAEPRGHAIHLQAAGEAFAHFRRRLVGEGQREEVAGVDAPLLDKPGHALDDDARLAASGPGKHEERAVR